MRPFTSTSTVFFTILLTLFLTAFEAAHGQSKIYWIGADANGIPDTIRRANLDGSGVEDVVTVRLDEPSSLEIDFTAGKIYWSAAGEIGRANLDGTQVEKAVVLETSGFFTPISRGVSLDESAGKIYWIEGDAILRANLDGSETEELITTTVVDSEGIKVDPTGGKVYWTNSEFSGGVIRRANLDGSGIEDLVSDGLFSPQKIDLDVGGGKMYWTDLITNDVFRANLDGSSVEEIVTDQDNPDGIALDLSNAKVYWVDRTEDAVRRANLDGSEVEDLPMIVDRPIDVAVDAASGHLYVIVESGELYRSNLDGSDSQLLIAPITGFEAMALDMGEATLYWGSRDALQRSDLDGNNVENIAIGTVGEIRLDRDSGRAYWTAFDGIHGVDLDGSNEALVVEGDQPFNLILDAGRENMYWLGDGNPVTADKIRTSNLDGSEASILLPGRDEPNRLTLDAEAGYLFWTEGNFSFGSVIRRADVDGTNVTDVVTEQVGGSIAIHSEASKIYWSDRRIKRANLDGSEVEELHSAAFTVYSLTLDPAGGKMYWVTEERIERANLDGSGVEVLVTDLARPENLIVYNSTATSIDDEVPVADGGYRLETAFPNPFRDRAIISLSVDRPQNVDVHLYNALGQRVSTLYSGSVAAGVRVELDLHAADKPGGMYFYRVSGEDFQSTGKVILVR